MKKLLLLIVLGLFTIINVEAKEYEKSFEQANAAYDSGDYIKASQLYSDILSDDYVSSEIYYNLGNCYSKMDKLALSILYYNRAALLDPSDENIKYNLEIATTKTTNRIEQLPEFFLQTWTESIRQMFSSNQWAIIGLVMLAIMLASIVIFYFSNKSFVRKLMFAFSVTALFVMILSFVFSSTQKQIILSSNVAIVMNNAVAVKSSPSQGGTDLFILNEGAKVEVKEVVGDWSEVILESGNMGWLKTATIEYIRP